MFKYKTGKLDSRLYLEALHKWVKQQLVLADKIPQEYLKDAASYKPYSWLKRFGLYLLTTLAIQSCIGFLFFIILSGMQIDYDDKPIHFLMSFSGFTLYITLGRYVNANNIYKQGTDDAWLHYAVFYTYTGILLLLDIESHSQAGIIFGAVLLCCLTGLATYQYADSFLFIVCIFSLNFIPLYIVSMINHALLFFAVLMVVPLNLFVIRTLNRWDTLQYHYWYQCLMMGRVTACIMIYLSVNLYVIRSLAYKLMGSETIPLQPVFLTLTILTPLIFIGLGIKQKLKHLLYTGLLLLLPTVATIRYYYSVMPVELACMIGGLILIVVSYLAIRYLQQTEGDYTFEPDHEENFSDAEVLILLQQFGKTDTQHAPAETKMGGGEFGGGGSGGGF